MDEIDLIYRYYEKYKLHHKENIMFDVGAAGGTTFLKFAKKGWIVHAFEPVPSSFNLLKSLVNGKKYKVTLNNVCIGDKEEKNKDFYLSKESKGISSLVDFHKTHTKANFRTNIIRLDNYISKKNINNINFLKIDTEGYDLFVLKSVPWDLIKPDIVICEFEDKKTKTKLKYTWNDMAEYLKNLDYHIIISEWRPIVKYGIKHTWNKFKIYPNKLDDDNAWGNLIAIRDDNRCEEFLKFIKLKR